MRKLSYIEAVCTINFVMLLVIMAILLEQFTSSNHLFNFSRPKEPVLTPAQVEAIKKGSGSRSLGSDSRPETDDSADPNVRRQSRDKATGEDSDSQSTPAVGADDKSAQPDGDVRSEGEPE